MRQITTGINEGYYDKTSGPLQIKAFHTMIEEGEILRDWREPFKKSQVALALAGGAYPNMDRTQQNALSEKLTGQDRAEENRRAAEAKGAREQAVSEIEKNITDAVSAQQWQVAKDWVRRGRDDMTGTEYQHWTKIITDPELKTSSAVVGYARALDLWGKAGKFDIIVPYTSLSGSAIYKGDPVLNVRSMDSLILSCACR